MSKYRDLIKKGSIPRHIAIIMDGNGRWAEKKSLPREEGHKKGASVIESLMDAALQLKIDYVSVYAFSTENWARPVGEIKALWTLLDHFFTKNLKAIAEKGIKIVHSGSLKRLPSKVKKNIQNAIEDTKNNKKLTFNICLNYGSRQEIVDSVNSWLENSKENEKLTEKKLTRNFYNPDIPDVDLLIRTSGELRISNFMLWQNAYAEFIFLKILWPDFKPSHLYKTIYEYQQRKRRFGGL